MRYFESQPCVQNNFRVIVPDNFVFYTTEGVQKNARQIFFIGTYANFAAARVKRETLRAARFFGITLPAAFIILLSALRTAATAAALSPDAIALMAFLFSVFTALRRAVFIAFFFAVTKTLFLDDLWFATLFSFYLFLFSGIL